MIEQEVALGLAYVAGLGAVVVVAVVCFWTLILAVIPRPGDPNE